MARRNVTTHRFERVERITVAGITPAFANASYANIATEATAAAASARSAVLAFNVYDPSDAAYGAVRDDSSSATMTANVAAIQAAADDAEANDGILVIKGTYYTDANVQFRCHVAAESGVIRVSDTTITAVRAGDATSGAYVADRIMVLPEVYQDGKTALGSGVWGTDVGLELANLISCHVTVRQVNGFATGVHATAIGTGFVYNEISFAHIRNNKINLHLNPQTGGWINECNWYGGRFSYLSGEGTNIVGARHIKVSGNGAHPVNNHRFLKPSIEGDGPEYHIDCETMMYSVFDQARWEATTPKANLNNCSGVVLWQGYNAGSIVVSGSGSLATQLWTRDWAKIVSGGGARGVLRLGNVTSNGNPAITIGATSAASDDLSTAYTVAMGANTTKFKRSTDAQARITIDGQNGRIWGDSTGTADSSGNYIRPIGVSSWQCSKGFGMYGVSAPATQPVANPDTSGATLAELEAEVNQLKALLRSFGLMAT